MTVPESTNRLLHEIKKSLPYWEERWEDYQPEKLLPHLSKQETIAHNIIDDDEEVIEAFINLIKSIQDEQKTST